jgi:hypothetical protein
MNNSQDMLEDVADMDKKVDLSIKKKKRGRPLKTVIDDKDIKLVNKKDKEGDVVAVHLPISLKDIEKNNLNLNDLNKEIESIGNEISESHDDNIKTIKNYKYITKSLTMELKKVNDENKELKDYIYKITPMYHTEIEFYPNYINIKNCDGMKIIPKKTKTCCLYCGYSINHLPVYLINYHYDDTFVKMGDENIILFCSFNCASSHNISLNDDMLMKRYALLVKLYYEINKKDIISITDIIINEAGPREILEKYGGTMSIEEYRTNFKILGKEYQIMTPPFTSSQQCIKATTISKTDTNWILNNNPNSTKNILKKKASKGITDNKNEMADNAFDYK